MSKIKVKEVRLGEFCIDSCEWDEPLIKKNNYKYNFDVDDIYIANSLGMTLQEFRKIMIEQFDAIRQFSSSKMHWIDLSKDKQKEIEDWVNCRILMQKLTE